MTPVVGLVGLGLFHRGFPAVGTKYNFFAINEHKVCYMNVHYPEFLSFLLPIISFQLGNCVEIGLPMLFLVIGLSQVSKLYNVLVQLKFFSDSRC